MRTCQEIFGVHYQPRTTAHSHNYTSAEVSEWSLAAVQRRFAVVINGYVSVCLIVIGCTLNALCMLIFAQPRLRRQRPMIYYYLTCLSLWDSLLLCPGALLMYTLPTLYFGKLEYFAASYSYVYPYAYYLSNVTLTGSVWIVMALTIDKYLALCYPLQHKELNSTRVLRILLAISAAAFVYGLPELFKLGVSHCLELDDGHNATVPFISQTPWSNSVLYSFWYRMLCGLTLYSLAPFLLLFALTIRISMEMRRASTRRQQMMSIKRPSSRTAASEECRERESEISVNRASSQINRQPKAHTKNSAGDLMLISVISKFFACRILCVVLDILERTNSDSFNSSRLVAVLVDVSNLLVVANSATNFFVYAYFSQRFKQALVEMYTGTFCSMRAPNANTTANATNNPPSASALNASQYNNTTPNVSAYNTPLVNAA